MWAINCCLGRNRRVSDNSRSRTPLLRARERSEKSTQPWWQFWRTKTSIQQDESVSYNTFAAFDGRPEQAVFEHVSDSPDFSASNGSPQWSTSNIWTMNSDLTLPELADSVPFSPFENPRAPPPPPPGQFEAHGYTIIRKLNYEVQGKLFLVKHTRSGELCIIKQISMDDNTDDCYDMPREAYILLQCGLEDHSNILYVKHYFEDKKRGVANVVYEYCDAGDISNLIEASRDRGESVDPMFVLHFIVGMIRALAFLHYGVQQDGEVSDDQVPIIHQDVKPGNVFLTWSEVSENGMPDIVLGDFGMAYVDDETNRGARGTPAYWPPEVDAHWRRQEKERREKNQKAAYEKAWTEAGDMYSFGATLFELVTLQYYRPGMDIAEAIMISSLAGYPEIAVIVLDILERCLSPSPDERPRADDFLTLCDQFEQTIQNWYEAGGRIPQGTFPDPFYHDDQVLAAARAPRQQRPTTFPSTPSSSSSPFRSTVLSSILNPYLLDSDSVSGFGMAFPVIAAPVNDVSPYGLSDIGDQAVDILDVLPGAEIDSVADSLVDLYY